MNGDQKFWLGLWFIFGVVALIISLASITYHHEKYKAMIEGGYEQGVLPGKSDVYWIKAEATK